MENVAERDAQGVGSDFRNLKKNLQKFFLIFFKFFLQKFYFEINETFLFKILLQIFFKNFSKKFYIFLRYLNF